MARSVYCVTLSQTPGGQNLCQIVKKDTFCSAEQFAQAVLFIYYIIIIIIFYLLFYTYKSFLGSCLRDCTVKIAEKYFLEAATGLLRPCTP
jgi:hypothetical protein